MKKPNKPSKWEQDFPMLDFAYTNFKYTSTGYSPFMLMYSFQPHVNIHCAQLETTQNFLMNMQYMLFST